jgi:hypothetical protein
MTNATRQQTAGGVAVACAIVMVYCMARMIPNGLAGNFGKVKGYFIVLMVAFIISLPCGVIYYYRRYSGADDKVANDEEERLRTQTEALSHYGQAQMDEKRAANANAALQGKKR